MEYRNIKIILLIFFTIGLLFGCGVFIPKIYDDTNIPYLVNLVNHDFILVKDLEFAKLNKKIINSKKASKYFILTEKIIIPKSKYKIVGKLQKGTRIKFKNAYTYVAHIDANGLSFYTAEILNGENKGLIFSPSGILEDIWVDKANLKSQKIFNPLYAVEATPENVARIEKELEEEKQKK